jgi:hypothetical protein
MAQDQQPTPTPAVAHQEGIRGIPSSLADVHTDALLEASRVQRERAKAAVAHIRSQYGTGL